MDMISWHTPMYSIFLYPIQIDLVQNEDGDFEFGAAIIPFQRDWKYKALIIDSIPWNWAFSLVYFVNFNG